VAVWGRHSRIWLPLYVYGVAVQLFAYGIGTGGWGNSTISELPWSPVIGRGQKKGGAARHQCASTTSHLTPRTVEPIALQPPEPLQHL
jgi:hypothetical protein